MKKTLLSIVFATASAVASAQTYHALPTTDDPYLAGICISADGKYVGGMDYVYNLFLADWAKDDIKTYEPDDETGCCIRSVSNTGVGVGFNGDNAITFDINGNYTVLPGKEGMAMGTTPDGTFWCGSINTNSVPQPVYWKTSDSYTELPMPTKEECGINVYGATAKYVNNDASIIAGTLVDKLSTRPFVLWRRDADGNYTVDPVFKKYCPTKTPDGNGLACYFTITSMSKNGKWAAVTVSENNTLCIARYNIENDRLEVLSYDDLDEGNFCMSSGIADDGTIIGYTDNDDSSVRKALICKAGETTLKPLSEVYSSIANLAYFDDLETHFNIAADITPDARYILGYAKDIDIIGGEEAEIFVTYVIDTDTNTTTIKNVTTKSANNGTKYYSTDGKQISINGYHGLVIEKDAQGNTKKIMK